MQEFKSDKSSFVCEPHSPTQLLLMEAKKRILLYGNCQLLALKKILESNLDFLEQFEILHVNDIHLLSSQDIDLIYELLPTVDYFVYQHVENYRGDSRFNTNNLKQELKPHAKHFSFPSLYFRGYTPAIIYLNDSSGSLTYTDANIYYLIHRGWSTEAIENLIQSDEFYTPAEYIKIVSHTIREISFREAQNLVDLHVSDFIIDNFACQKLFYTFNHPSKILMLFVAGAALKFLGLNLATNSAKIDESSINFIQHPIYPSISNYLRNREIFIQDYLSRPRFSNEVFKKASFSDLIVNTQQTYRNSSKDIIEKNLYLLMQKRNKQLLSHRVQELM